MMYELPNSVEINGACHSIRSDYRAILDICAALCDPELSDSDKGRVLLDIFYPELQKIQPCDYGDAINQCFAFIRCGADDDPHQPAPKLMDWEQDFKYIVAPVNRVIGQEIRSLPYLHWWSFIAAYYEIGDCVFAQIVRIRDQKQRGRPLSKEDRKWYREHHDMVDLRTKYTQAEDDLLSAWTAK